MLFPICAASVRGLIQALPCSLVGQAHSKYAGLLPKDENSRAREKEAGLPPAQVSPDRAVRPVTNLCRVGTGEWEQHPGLNPSRQLVYSGLQRPPDWVR